MKKISCYFQYLVCLIGFALCFSLSADAQFLNKLTKGLEKVKKSVEQVDKTLNNKAPQKQNKTQNSTTTSRNNQPVQVKEENNSVDYNDVSDDGQENNDNQLKELLKDVGYPYITPETKFLEVSSAGNLVSLTNAHEGIFGISMHKKVLDNHIYGFWTVDGKKLFDAEWEDMTYQNNSPEFHDGVVPMRKTGSTVMKKQPIYLLYSDGRSKMIPNSQSWFSVTNFMDGLAIAHGPVADGKCFYINTSGEKVFPHIVMNGMPLGGMRPLRDGLRAFCIGTGKWGYIDEKGAIKFPAKFKDAGNFSEGYAWVVTEDGVKQLIDKTGKSVFKAENRNVRTSEVVNGIFYISDPVKNYMDYYDLYGNKLLTVESGNQFCDGYAYIYIPKSSFDLTTPISIIDTNMKVVKTLPPEIIEWAEVSEHKPVFNSKDLATVYSGLVYQGSSIIRPNGTIILRRYFNAEYGSGCDYFSPVCDAGYLKAKITYYVSDNEVKGEAIMKTTGEVVCIVSDANRAAGPLSKNDIRFPTQNFPDNNTPVYLKSIN